MRSTNRGLTLVEILVVLVVLGVAATMILPALGRAGRHGRVEACAAHLRQLHQAAEAYRAKCPQAPEAPGKAYWVRLTKTDPPLVAADALRCPVRETSDAPPGPAECQYLGPAGNPAQLGDADPLGCDDYLNHHPQGKEGGNVLRKDGTVVTDLKGIWIDATRMGKCRP
jgi:prepilin-type N-terminal cleavage/methylation domain-containing protein